MGAPKVTKPSDLRADLYNTLDRVCKGEKVIVPGKEGEVVLLSKREYDGLVEDLDLLKEFEEPVDQSLLLESDLVLSGLAKKYGFSDAGSLDKKSRKKSR